MVQPSGATPAPRTAAVQQAPPRPVAPASAGGSMARKHADVSRLRVKKMERGMEARPPPHVIRVRGPKGLKTIASIVVPTSDSVNSRGDPVKATPGFPVPNGTVLVVSFDNQTEGSIDVHYGESAQAPNDAFFQSDVRVLHICRDLGYTQADPSTGEVVVDTLFEFLKQYADAPEEGKLSQLVFDRLDVFYEKVLESYIRSRTRTPIGDKIDGFDWGPRRTQYGGLYSLGQSCIKEGGILWLVGPEERGDGEKRGQLQGKKMVASTSISKWEQDLDHDVSCRIDLDYAYGKGSNKVIARWANIPLSRIPFIPEGARVDIQGRHLGACQLPECVELPEPEKGEPEDETPQVVPPT